MADAKLGGSIQEKLDLSCVYDSKLGELMRCFRNQISGLISEGDEHSHDIFSGRASFVKLFFSSGGISHPAT